jgi:hypothetical protein
MLEMLSRSRGAQPVAGHVDHVVGPAQDVVVAVGIADKPQSKVL